MLFISIFKYDELQAEATNVPNAEFGDDWFMWENWRVNKLFMDEFYNEINRYLLKKNIYIDCHTLFSCLISTVKLL